MPKNERHNLSVVLRMRPLLRRELKQNKRSLIRVVDHHTIIFDPHDEETRPNEDTTDVTRSYERIARKNLKLSFDRVFSSESTNNDIFQYAMRPLISSVLKGYNCSAFVYGVTGNLVNCKP